MLAEKFEELRANMEKKLGAESMALISDDISTLMLDNNEMNNQISNKDKEISTLKKDKENLVISNGNLLQKISMESNQEREDRQTETKKKYSLSNCFDDKGNFK